MSRVPRSTPSAAMATFQPSPGAPTTRSAEVRAESKKTSQNSPSPSMLVIGRTCTPGCRAGTRSSDSPWCREEPGSVRHSTYSQSADAPNVIQIFWPSMTHSSPTFSAHGGLPPPVPPGPSPFTR